MRLEHEPVTVSEIANRLGYSRHAVNGWIYKSEFFPPFPPARWRPSYYALYDWPLVLAWYELTHHRKQRAA